MNVRFRENSRITNLMCFVSYVIIGFKLGLVSDWAVNKAGKCFLVYY